MKGCPHTRKIICCNYAYMITSILQFTPTSKCSAGTIL